MLCYNNFVAKLHNWCLALGFTPGKIMPSRAFCSDESQGFPIILIAKHFGAFPFNHGRVGGIVSIDRHGPHADHGKDLLLLQASHVGYDPASGKFGIYRRVHTEQESFSCSCGKIGHIVERHTSEYHYASQHIHLLRHEGKPALLIDNLLLEREREEGLFLVIENLVEGAIERKLPRPMAARSTGNIYQAAAGLVSRLGPATWPDAGSRAIGTLLAAEDFYYRRNWSAADRIQNQLEYNLSAPMPWIVTAPHPLLTAACANTLAEFDRTYRSLVQSPAMRGKNVLFVSGLNIDISPDSSEDFPLTKFVPWAGYLQRADGSQELLEQDELIERLGRQSSANPAQIDLERAIASMTSHAEVAVRL
ncbi:MAG: hypothetical protein AB1697_00380 [Pseudomonadota bacterium]